ncbi:MAG TPA: PhnD/SsuA/transferrin family substrate-binding protein [Burkholderiaceae bacterium]|nr:PhnD/SsuA/transferrin family substrate-binding protein [Burkholderiaceae bacterium]HRZ02121.1 PhnD/SsuA/transferrin family substrate-binding protein [Burkholderiaceae bacterium]HRZ59916.1 PhnD/SsuA/transferrin family substrate-binding protein [Rubrivivax sp.]
MRPSLRLLLLLALIAVAAPAAAVTVGVLSPEGGARAEAQWRSTREHLRRALGDPDVAFRHYDFPGIKAAVARGEVEFVILNGGLYTEIEAAHGVSRIATLLSPRGRSPKEAMGSTVLVSAQRPELARLADLVGQRIAVVDTAAFGGWQIAQREFQRRAIDVDALRVEAVGFPMQDVVRRVLDGRADAGVVRTCVVEDMIERGELAPGAVRALNVRTLPGEACERSTPLLPDWAFATLPDTPEPLARQVAVALLHMPVDGDGVRWTVPTDYQPVRDLFRELQIGPYEHLRESTLQDFMRRWWFLFALGALVMVGGAAHTVRTEWLLQRRTTALRAAMLERERLMHEAREQQEQLDHLSRLGALGELSSMLAHELAQPLAAIGNFARGIGRRIDAGRLDPQPLRAAATDIAQEAERATAVMSRIRDFARKRQVAREPLAVASAVQAAARVFEGALHDAPAVRVEFDLDPSATVLGDRLQIEQLMLNLLKNAYDATRAVSGRVPTVRVRCVRNDGEVQVCVIDNGAGLAPETARRMFEPFFSTKPDGLGLGLALARRVVEAHGGRLWAEPAARGPGLSVCFTLPLAEELADVV